MHTEHLQRDERMTEPAQAAGGPVERFLAAVAAGDVAACTAWSDDVHLDATVPGWRFVADGIDAIRAEYGGWFKDPAVVEQLRRIPTPNGEVVDYLLTWIEHGVPHAAHHVHILDIDDGFIAADTVMCGGRWPAGLLAEIEAARGGGS